MSKKWKSKKSNSKKSDRKINKTGAAVGVTLIATGIGIAVGIVKKRDE